MNAMKSVVVGMLCLSAVSLFGETYEVTDVTSLTVALGKAGDNSVWANASGVLDLSGQPRIRDKIVDMGCYECTPWGLLMMVK